MFIVNPYQEIDRLKKENEELRIENRQFKEDIKTLIAKVDSLAKLLSRYEKPKNSGNSSIPPSHD
jgi:predicted RNase H-like nuclease (RuvC/YqgF family)